jgi:hypothetical protein
MSVQEELLHQKFYFPNLNTLVSSDVMKLRVRSL